MKLLGFWLLFGSVTFYPISRFEGQPLYCSTHDHPLTYSQQTAQEVGPWVALDVGLYQSGRVKCGEELVLWLEGGGSMRVKALDAGRFGGYWVADWPDLPIIADLPEYFSSSSKRGVLLLLP